VPKIFEETKFDENYTPTDPKHEGNYNQTHHKQIAKK
jgi:hypothetical protein